MGQMTACFRCLRFPEGASTVKMLVEAVRSYCRAPFCLRSFVFCFCYSRCLETGLLAPFATKLVLRRRFKVPSPVCADSFPLVTCSSRIRKGTLFVTGKCFEHLMT